MAEATKVEVDSDFNKKSSTGMEPKIAILLAYLFSFVGGLIVWLIEKENKFVKWNALQAMILGIVELGSVILFSAILGWIPFIGWYFFSWIGWVIWAAAWVLGIVAIVMGFQGKTFRIPGIAGLTDKYFKM
jgi:uncharacterized membrane protein